MFKLKRLPKTGDRFYASGYLFEIVDMDGKRVDKLLVKAVP
jgi:putative hemolysin